MTQPQLRRPAAGGPTMGTRDRPLAPPAVLRRSAPAQRRVARLFALTWAFWTAFGVVVAANERVRAGSERGDVLWDALIHCVPFYWLWALLTPPIIVLAARVRPAPGRWVRGWTALAAAGPVVAAVHAALYSLFWLLVDSNLRASVIGPDVAASVRRHALGDVVTYAALVGTWYVVGRYRRAREQLAAAKLDALTAQLRPHFLFNALQVVSTLMHRDVGAADEMLARLSELLRLTLRREPRALVPLAEELELLDHYVAIMRERFGPRVTFALEVTPEARQSLVPLFVLQPLVENAFQHGIGGRVGAGRVEVAAARRDGRLVLTVADDGPGLMADAASYERIGLSNTRQRLRELYGDAHTFALDARPGGGLRVTITLPAREGPAR